MKIPDDEASNINPEEFEKERTRVKEIFSKISFENGPTKTSPFFGTADER